MHAMDRCVHFTENIPDVLDFDETYQTKSSMGIFD